MPDKPVKEMTGQVGTRLGRVALNPRGAYAAETTYDRLDLVRYEGSAWLCLADGTSTAPVEGEAWTLYVEKGDPGGLDTADEEALQAIKDSTDTIKTDTATIKGDTAALKTDTASLKQDTASIKEDVGAVKEDVGGVKTDVASVKTDVAGVKTDVAGVKTDVAAVKKSTDTILEKLSEARPKRYGYRIKKSEANPATRVEYIYDAEGMTPAKMDFAEGTFNYGSWKDIWFVRDNYPCMLNPDGTEAYRLNPDDYSKKLGDNAASAVSDLTGTLNAMAAFPLVWVKRWEEGDYEYTVFCESQYDESYKAYAHTKANGDIARVVYTACFKGCLDTNSKLRSIAGQYPQYSTAAQAEIDAAKKNGTLWSIRPWALQNLIADLCTLISKTDNSQAAFGQGQTSGYVNDAAQHYGHLLTGTLMGKGQFFGYSTTTQQVKVFHVESFWGGRWDRLAGLIQRNGVYLAKMTPEDGGYNLTGEGYTPMAKSLENLAASGSGWQHFTHNSPLGRVPIGPFNGSDATNDCDFFWWNQGITAVAIAGGNCRDGSRCGSRSLFCNFAASGAGWAFGASPTCEGPSV